VDFSDTSREVVAQALRVANQDQSNVHFLHVFCPPWKRFGFGTASPQQPVDYADRHQTRLRSRLKEFVGAVGSVPVSYEVVEGGSHGHAIAGFCRSVDAKLIILGRRGKTDLKYVLLGSTAERLLRELPTSLLVVQPAADESPGRDRTRA
jgi:nucleotide-binding universal stress UspA family protein